MVDVKFTFKRNVCICPIHAVVLKMQNSLRFGRILCNHIAAQKSLYHKFNISNFDEYFTRYFNKCKESITHRNHHVNLEQLVSLLI